MTESGRMGSEWEPEIEPEIVLAYMTREEEKKNAISQQSSEINIKICCCFLARDKVG